MGTVMAAGVTHFPPLALPDARMADVFRWAVRDPALSEDRRDPQNLSALLRKELSDDDGLAAAAAHREELRVEFQKVRDALDDFKPDIVIVWGDDQYELFREDCVPPFAVCAFDRDIAQGKGLREFGHKERFEVRHAHFRDRHIHLPCSRLAQPVTLG